MIGGEPVVAGAWVASQFGAVRSSGAVPTRRGAGAAARKRALGWEKSRQST